MKPLRRNATLRFAAMLVPERGLSLVALVGAWGPGMARVTKESLEGWLFDPLHAIESLWEPVMVDYDAVAAAAGVGVDVATRLVEQARALGAIWPDGEIDQDAATIADVALERLDTRARPD